MYIYSNGISSEKQSTPRCSSFYPILIKKQSSSTNVSTMQKQHVQDYNRANPDSKIVPPLFPKLVRPHKVSALHIRILPIPFVDVACRFQHDPTYSSHSRNNKNCMPSQCPSENDTTQHCQNSHLLKMKHTPRIISPINLHLQNNYKKTLHRSAKSQKPLQNNIRATAHTHARVCLPLEIHNIKVCKIRLF